MKVSIRVRTVLFSRNDGGHRVEDDKLRKVILNDGTKCGAALLGIQRWEGWELVIGQPRKVILRAVTEVIEAISQILPRHFQVQVKHADRWHLCATQN
jgi:hypothetical protein